jgi:tRNA modification GTPase
VPLALVLNKMDIASAAQQATHDAGLPVLVLSAASGEGIAGLRRHISSRAGQGMEGGGAISARARHVDALRRASSHLDAAHRQLAAKQGELAALELREAQRELGEVVGDVTSDELLGRIFSSFCIGK